MSIDWVRRRWKVPAVRGGKVVFDGKPGRILSAKGGVLRIRCNDEILLVSPCELVYNVVNPEEKKPC
jgi:hypothetical protein